MIKMPTLGIFFAAAFLFTEADATDHVRSAAYQPGLQAYINANIIGATPQAIVLRGALLVRNGQIEKIQPKNKPIPDNYTVVDLNHQWVMPGIIDGHVHLAQSGSAFTRPDIIDARKIQTYTQDQQWLDDNRHRMLQRYLDLGIVAIFDLGGPSAYLQKYAQTANTGLGPDIFASAELISTADVPALGDVAKTFLLVQDAKQATAAVNMQTELPIHIVKFVWTDESNQTPQQLLDLYSDAMAQAKLAGKIIAVHVEDLEYAKVAIKAGADVLIHGVMTSAVDNEFLSLAKQHGVTYMPSLTAYHHYIDLFKQAMDFSDLERALAEPEVLESFNLLQTNASKADQMYQVLTRYIHYVDDEKSASQLSGGEKAMVKQIGQLFSQSIYQYQQQNLRAVIGAGISVAIGTDAGNPGTLHGVSMLGEVQAWLDAGVSMDTIITAMTEGNAKAYKVNNTLGSLNSGKDASFVVYERNPATSDFINMLPKMVVHKGKVVQSSKETHL